MGATFVGMVKTSGVRCSEAEFRAWRAVAEAQGLPFNRWARRALNEQLELDRALLRERDDFVTLGDGLVEPDAS